MFEKLRGQISTERKNRLSEISAVQNELSEMEAELRIGAAELEEMDMESSDEESDYSSD